MGKKRRFVNWATWFNERPFVKIMQQTMIILFPVALIGSFTWMISDNLLATNGFLANIFRVRQWLPYMQFWRQLFNDITLATIGLVSPYAAFTSATLTTYHYKHPNIIAGLTAAATYILIFFHSQRGAQTIEMRYYNAGWLIVAVLIGYAIGLIFAKWGKEFSIADVRLRDQQLMSKSLANLPLVVGILSGAFVLHLGYALLRIFNLDVTANQILTSSISKNSNYLLNGFLSLTNTISVWLGFAEPIRLSAGAYNNEVTSNLVHALTHKTLVNVPYPFTPSSLYNGFANFGGVGVTLALVIGILWLGRHRNQQTVAMWSALPAIFNTGLPILFGAQVFLTPFFVLPFVFLPVLNMVIASGFIFLHIIPPIVYPVPNGTPGILVPFIGTGGDWRALVLSIALLILDIAVYLPFIKWAFEPHQTDGGKGASQNEND